MITPNDTSARRMGDTVGAESGPPNHGPDRSLPVRLARRWGVKPQTASWMTYSMERGLRARVVDVVRELGPVKARQWLAPVYAAIAEGQHEIDLHRLIHIDAEGDVAVGDHLTDDDGDLSDTRRACYLALEKKGAACYAVAARLRAEEEASHA